MKVGTLVKPLGTCSGAPGSVRCQTAVVIGVATPSDPMYARTVRIVCPCGVSDQYHHQLEAIEGKK